MSKFKIGDKVIVRKGVNDTFFSEGAKGVIVGERKYKTIRLLGVEFFEGDYLKNLIGGKSKWWALPEDIKSLEKGKARAPKKPIRSITKKYKFNYRYVLTLRMVEAYRVNTLKETEDILIKLRRKGFKWSTGKTINKNDFTKHYRKHFGKFKPIYIFANPNGSITWIEAEKGSWTIKKIK